MKCKIKVLSPLHIGNGNELKMVDFYLDDDKKLIKRINFNKFINYCFENEINLMEELNKRHYKTGKDFSITKFMDTKGIDPDGFTSYKVPAIIQKRERESEFAVKEHVKCGGAYIPGSSIKGAIRTALMWSFLNEGDNVNVLFNELDYWLREKGRIDLKKIDDRISQEVFGNDAHHDIFRALRISDTNTVGMEHLEVSEIKIVGNSQEIPVYVENLKTGTEATFDLHLDEDLLNTEKREPDFKNHKLREYMHVNKICEVCNAFSKKVVEEHLEYNWKKYNHVCTRDTFKNLKSEIKSCGDNETVLHIGWGGGWYSTTIGLLVEDHPKFTTSLHGNVRNWRLRDDTLRYKFKLGNKPRSRDYSINFPKTRRITIEGEPLGWVKIMVE
ncbi:MAG: RAMP superfamily protein [Candidatus Argoarchaeum ethanivorans]|uniref:CRISPR system Cms protein Csm5 n=1 Tax=Candidatus Argoarchaeum ethanivorans TaxID=2608793 RepID=A0A811TH03_9EURY|nr:MAG: RAMP superfamily protein [Candidatus Argoarchaeum ethanivorans]